MNWTSFSHPSHRYLIGLRSGKFGDAQNTQCISACCVAAEQSSSHADLCPLYSVFWLIGVYTHTVVSYLCDSGEHALTITCGI